MWVRVDQHDNYQSRVDLQQFSWQLWGNLCIIFIATWRFPVYIYTPTVLRFSFFQFEIIINGLVSSFCYIWIYMLLVYGHYNCLRSFNPINWCSTESCRKHGTMYICIKCLTFRARVFFVFILKILLSTIYFFSDTLVKKTTFSHSLYSRLFFEFKFENNLFFFTKKNIHPPPPHLVLNGRSL